MRTGEQKFNIFNKIGDYYNNQRNTGEILRPDTIGEAENSDAGLICTLYINVFRNKIFEIKFKTLGCVTAIACTSMLTELAKGKRIEEALKITSNDISIALGGVPKEKMHCCDLAVEALKNAVNNLRQRKRAIG